MQNKSHQSLVREVNSINNNSIYLRNPKETKDFIGMLRNGDSISNDSYSKAKLSTNKFLSHFSQPNEEKSFLFRQLKDAFIQYDYYNDPENVGLFEGLKPLEKEKNNYLNVYSSNIDTQELNGFELDVPIARIFEDGTLKINPRFNQDNLSDQELLNAYHRNENANCVYYDEINQQIIVKSLSKNDDTFEIEEIKFDYDPNTLNFTIRENKKSSYNYNNEKINSRSFLLPDSYHNAGGYLEPEYVSYERVDEVINDDGTSYSLKTTVDPNEGSATKFEINEYDRDGEKISVTNGTISNSKLNSVTIQNPNSENTETYFLDNIHLLYEERITPRTINELNRQKGYTEKIEYNEKNEEIKTIANYQGDYQVFIDNELSESYNANKNQKIFYENGRREKVINYSKGINDPDGNKVSNEKIVSTEYYNENEFMTRQEYSDGRYITFEKINGSEQESDADIVKKEYNSNKQLTSETFYKTDAEEKIKLSKFFYSDDSDTVKETYDGSYEGRLAKKDYRDGSYDLFSYGDISMKHLNIQHSTLSKIETCSVQSYNKDGKITMMKKSTPFDDNLLLEEILYNDDEKPISRKELDLYTGEHVTKNYDYDEDGNLIKNKEITDFFKNIKGLEIEDIGDILKDKKRKNEEKLGEEAVYPETEGKTLDKITDKSQVGIQRFLKGKMEEYRKLEAFIKRRKR